MELPNEVLNLPPEHEIATSRIFTRGSASLYKAWTDPKHLAKWWGPNGFTNTFYEFDLRPGGKWSFTMHGPDKGNYLNECVFIKIIDQSLLVWNHLSNPKFQVQVTFEERGPDKTMVAFKLVFLTIDECNKIKAFAAGKNEENLDRLELELTNIV